MLNELFEFYGLNKTIENNLNEDENKKNFYNKNSFVIKIIKKHFKIISKSKRKNKSLFEFRNKFNLNKKKKKKDFFKKFLNRNKKKEKMKKFKIEKQRFLQYEKEREKYQNKPKINENTNEILKNKIVKKNNEKNNENSIIIIDSNKKKRSNSTKIKNFINRQNEWLSNKNNKLDEIKNKLNKNQKENNKIQKFSNIFNDLYNEAFIINYKKEILINNYKPTFQPFINKNNKYYKKCLKFINKSNEKNFYEKNLKKIHKNSIKNNNNLSNVIKKKKKLNKFFNLNDLDDSYENNVNNTEFSSNNQKFVEINPNLYHINIMDETPCKTTIQTLN